MDVNESIVPVNKLQGHPCSFRPVFSFSLLPGVSELFPCISGAVSADLGNEATICEPLICMNRIVVSGRKIIFQSKLPL